MPHTNVLNQKRRVVFSVIVPVFNDWFHVPDLLACLHAQSLGAENFELLLVDNGSAHIPDTARLPSWAKLIHCKTPGSYAARNEAIKSGSGSFFVFTDADCRPAPQWLEQGLECLMRANDPAVIIAGMIVLYAADANRPTLYELYDQALGLPQERYVRRGYGITANLFVPRLVMETNGLFDASRFSGGDAEFCRRAVRNGIALRYCEDAMVRHPARRTWEDLASKSRRIKGGQIAAGSYSRRAYYVIRTLLPPFARLAEIIIAKHVGFERRIMICLIQIRLWFVEVVEMFRLLLGGDPMRK